jgi:hypothetical protein
MDSLYSNRLRAQLAAYKNTHLTGIPDDSSTVNGEDETYAHVLPEESYRANILPTIRDDFWIWFEQQQPKLKLHQLFHHLDSSQAMAFNLLFPFIRSGKADRRLLKVLGVVGAAEYSAGFDKMLHGQENTTVDFYLEADTGRRIFFGVKLAEGEFGRCAGDDEHQEKLREEYAVHLREHVDAKWLERSTFRANYQVLRTLSYLGRYPDSGAVFIFPKANEQLMEVAASIKQIVSKSLAPRVAILYLEYLVERILEAVAGDEPLRRHYLAFREKYICL